MNPQEARSVVKSRPLIGDISDWLRQTIEIETISLDSGTLRTNIDREIQTINQRESHQVSRGFRGTDDLPSLAREPISFVPQNNNFSLDREINLNSRVRPESIFGNDDRVLVTNTTTYPWSTIGQIRANFNGTWYYGTGAMISPYHMLTAGHNVYGNDLGGWVDDLVITLGRNGDEKFYGEADWTYIRTYTGWTNSEDPNHDWALITLDRNIGNHVGWLGYEWWSSDSVYNGMTVNTAGYPGDLGFDYMYYASGPTSYATANRVFYNGTMDTAGGQSGSPVWRYDGTSRYVNAIHAYGSDGYNNSGTRIDQTKFNSLQSWTSEDNGIRRPTDRPDLVDYDQWFSTDFAYFTPSTITPGSSFTARSVVRNNGTAAAGSFNVSFYASTNDIISTSDYFIGNVNISSLNPFNWADAIWSGTFPSIPVGNYYIGWLIDSGNSQTEFVESNNTGLISNSLLRVNSSNLPPNNINISNSSVNENRPSGTLVGSLSTIDPNRGDTHSYSLVSGVGSTDNSSFTIVGNELRTQQVFDFERKSFYNIRLRTTDNNGAIFEKAFVINVNNELSGTLAFHSSNFSIREDGTPVVGVRINRTNGTDGVVSVKVTPSNGTATSPADFSNTPITVSFAVGETSKTVNIPIVNDGIVDPNESLFLTLSNPTGGATLGTLQTAMVTIVDNDSLNSINQTGTIGNNIINGTLGNDTLNGAAGNDTLNGLNGNDSLIGDTGNDFLDGGAGNDNLHGGLGSDFLNGGLGLDSFIFNSANENPDIINSYNVSDDTIKVSASGFGGGLIAGRSISTSQFFVGSSANNSSDRFIYNRTNGSLFFDRDGTGFTPQVKIATLGINLPLTNLDIVAF